MSFGNRVLSTTQSKLMPKVADTVLRSNVGVQKIMGNPEKWSGEKLKVPFKIGTNSTFQSFSGYDLLSTEPADTRRNGEFDPKFSAITVSLPLTELSVNATSEKVIDLMAIEMESSAQDMADGVGTKFYGNGVGTDLSGLGLLVDDGSVSATYGGLSRTTFPGLSSTVTSSGGTISLAKVATLYDNASSGMQTPTLALTTKSIFSWYQELLQPQERIVKEFTMKEAGGHGTTGFKTLDYRGTPIMADEKCTTGQFILINDNFIKYYALPIARTSGGVKLKTDKIDGNDYDKVTNMGFSWSDWITPVNQAAIVSHIYLGGEFVNRNPRFSAKLTGITGV